MRRTVSPFLTAPSNSLTPAPWRQALGAEFVNLPKELEHWDYQTDLRLHSTVAVDRATILEACHLAPSSRLVLTASWHSDHTGITELAVQMPVPSEPQVSVDLEVHVPGALAGGRLALTRALVVGAAEPLDALAPHRCGDVLWSDTQNSHLQGSGAQFPTDAADFAVIRPDAVNAAWELRLDVTDPDALFLAAARLTLNTGKSAVVRMIEGATDEATKQLQSVLSWDMTRRLVLAGLASDDVIGRELDPDGATVADVLRAAIARVWPGEDPTVIRSWLDRDPGRVERDIQGHARIVE